MTRRFSGHLQQDSPSLWKMLGSVPTGPLQANIAQLYEKLVQRNDFEESNSGRTPGSSFNPKPVRVCDILWREAQVRDESELAAAMSCTGTINESVLSAPVWRLRKQVLQTLAGDFSGLEHAATARITLALVLDTLRHLHLSSESAAEQAAILELSSRVISHCGTETRLGAMVDKALERLRR